MSFDHIHHHVPPAQVIAQKYGLFASQVQHRLNVISAFDFGTSDRILEIGCGQGECTAVLAAALPKLKIDAVDPAPLDYGSPQTLGQAQTALKATNLGSRIQFHQNDPITLLSQAGEDSFDGAVLCHCLWYFSNEEEILQTLVAAKGKVKNLYVAEWALKATKPAAQAHVLAAMMRATCEAHIPDSDENIRTPVGPEAIKRLAQEAGWKLRKQDWIIPAEQLQDGGWEVDMLLYQGGQSFLRRAKDKIKEERIVVLLENMLEAVKNAASGGVCSMDVWVGVFT
ncbi:S-adenosyl-L-methionine-dependent methyltransferase [Polyplosphaeria fusca]|uniref:S-adenosyl-L-methionine-dependent methyltransferase n=1 Tax=Polyplosphaeria fusca TaxID=682080 RepID=A0A9P4QWW8_9PLEO|nr:S-adenosyl-L-methionine-dependent methyltransferase [Polyplosphaeria fusca]